MHVQWYMYYALLCSESICILGDSHGGLYPSLKQRPLMALKVDLNETPIPWFLGSRALDLPTETSVLWLVGGLEMFGTFFYFPQ